jgi:DNA-binding transcriptional MocR family regulator
LTRAKVNSIFWQPLDNKERRLTTTRGTPALPTVEALAGDLPLGRRIANYFRERIVSGEYPPGCRLPTVRTVAERLGTTAETVAAAYRLLSRQGLLRTRAGAGTFVQQGAPPGAGSAMAAGPSGEAGRKRLPLVPTLTTPSFHETYRRLLQTDRGLSFAGFGRYVAAPELAPTGIDRLLRAHVRQGVSQALQIGPPEGDPGLRTLVTGLAGVDTVVNPKQVLVTNGAQEALSLAFRALVAPGDAVAVESPTYLGALETLATLGARVIGIPMHPDGLDLAELETVIARSAPRVLYTMPSFQNPTGYTMSHAKRRRLLLLARRHGIVVIEDAAAADLAYDGPPPPALLAHGGDGAVVHVGSFSKTLLSGIRVGYLIAPEGLVEPLLRLKYVTNVHTPLLPQRLVYGLVSGQRHARHLRRVRAEYRARRDAMVDALGREVGGVATWVTPAGGFSVWVTLPRDVDAAELFRLAIDRGVSFVPGAVFFPSDLRHNTLRLCFSVLAPAAIARGVRLLAEAVTELLGRRTRHVPFTP